MLDTNACIGWIRQSEPRVVTRIQKEGLSNLFICSVVYGELCFGVERTPIIHRQKNRNLLQQFYLTVTSVPYDDIAAIVYGSIRAHLANQGTPIGPNDPMIAATAISCGLTLVTHNTAELSRVPGLMIEDSQ